MQLWDNSAERAGSGGRRTSDHRRYGVEWLRVDSGKQCRMADDHSGEFGDGKWNGELLGSCESVSGSSHGNNHNYWARVHRQPGRNRVLRAALRSRITLPRDGYATRCRAIWRAGDDRGQYARCPNSGESVRYSPQCGRLLAQRNGRASWRSGVSDVMGERTDSTLRVHTELL